MFALEGRIISMLLLVVWNLCVWEGKIGKELVEVVDYYYYF